MTTGTVLSLLVLAGVALTLGAIALWRRGGSRRQVMLMLVLAAIIAINIVIWTIPTAKSPALVSVPGQSTSTDR